MIVSIEIRELYQQMLDGWNKRDASAFAAPFAEDDLKKLFFSPVQAGIASAFTEGLATPSYAWIAHIY